MQVETESVCKTLKALKTTIMFLGKDAPSTCREFLGKVKDPYINNCIDIRCCAKINGQSSDIYVVNTNNLSDKAKLQIVKKIYKANPKAILFLIDVSNEILDLSQKVQSILDPTKMGQAIQGIINPKDKDFSEIISCISFMEDTKYKLCELWEKLAKTCD